MALISLAGCRRVSIPSAEMASRVTMSACPPAAPLANPNDVPPLASLTITLRTEPPVAPGTEANLRLENEITKSSSRVDATLPQPFSLTKGVYLVRVTLPGYVGVEGRAPLTAGCEANMTLVLKKP